MKWSFGFFFVLCMCVLKQNKKPPLWAWQCFVDVLNPLPLRTTLSVFLGHTQVLGTFGDMLVNKTVYLSVIYSEASCQSCGH